MRRHTILAAVSLLALSIAAPALAQEAEPLPVGSTAEGRIAEGDATAAEDAYRHDDYGFIAREGERLEAVMRSADFDAFLEVFHQEDLNTPLATDDDGLGEGTDSRLRFVAEQGGAYVLRARTLSGLEGGDYVLSLIRRQPAARAPRPSGIRLGQSVMGVLADTDPETDSGGVYDAFVFRAGAGDRYLIELNAEAFDPVVRVGRVRDRVFTELAMNDDGPDAGLNSRLIFNATEAGEYIIRATPVNAAGRGEYVLSLAQAPEPTPARAIAIGDTVTGALATAGGESASGRPADRWRFSGVEGQRVRVEMGSDDFDTYLELLDEADVGLAEDDDSGEGTNSRLILTLPQTGSYVVEARAFSDATGTYSLSITEVEPERPPEVMPFGATVQGEIGEGDSRDVEDRGFDAYAFSGTAGQRVQAIMRSGDFDTYLQLGAAGTDFLPLADDDDGLGEGTDSRLTFTLPDDGDYVLRALPLGSEGKGLYSLELIDRGPQPEPGSLLVGATARGTLTESDATGRDNSFYDAYRLDLKEDEALLITMASNDVDSFVVVGRAPVDGEFEPLASDDDSLSDTHAKLEWTAPADGTYEIRAGTFQPGQTGAYALRVEKQP